jgi:4-aminobutyrate aminotransferase
MWTAIAFSTLPLASPCAPAEQAHAAAEACFRHGLIVLECGQKSIRLSPPLVVTQEEADEALGLLADVLKEME